MAARWPIAAVSSLRNTPNDCCWSTWTSGASVTASSPGRWTRPSPPAVVVDEATNVPFDPDGTTNTCSLFAGFERGHRAMCQTVHIEGGLANHLFANGVNFCGISSRPQDEVQPFLACKEEM